MVRTAEMNTNTAGRNKPERKTIEKNRRMYMKALCYKMVSLIPSHHFNLPKEFLSQQDQLEQAAGYIQQLSARVEELKKSKTQALSNIIARNDDITTKKNPSTSAKLDDLPVLKLRDLGSSLELILISRNFMLHKVISILQDEGAEVLTANLLNSGNKIFLTIHAKAKVARVGVDTSRICGRLQEFIS